MHLDDLPHHKMHPHPRRCVRQTPEVRIAARVVCVLLHESLCPWLQGWCLSSARRGIDKSHRDTIQRITTSKRRRRLDARPFLHIPEPGKIGCPSVRHLRCGCMKIWLAVRRRRHTLRRNTPLRRQDHRDGDDHAACCHDSSCEHCFLLSRISFRCPTRLRARAPTVAQARPGSSRTFD